MLRDHLGSTRVSVRSDGQRGVGYSYDALGNLIDRRSFGAPSDLAYRYTGQEYDRETGLHNFRARLYDSDLFRFYATDPAGQQHSPYAFVGNSPLMFRDPSGKIIVPILFGIAAGYLAGVGSSNGQLNPLKWNAGNWALAIGTGILGGLAAGGGLGANVAAQFNVTLNGVPVGSILGAGGGIGAITLAGYSIYRDSRLTNLPQQGKPSEEPLPREERPAPEGPSERPQSSVFRPASDDLWRHYRNYENVKPLSINDWAVYYKGRTTEGILGEQLIGRVNRYVTDPLFKYAELDMIHFLHASNWGGSGEFVGYLNEAYQWLGIGGGNKESAWYPQDFYSNRLGAAFGAEYRWIMMIKPEHTSRYIYDFLNNATSRMSRELYPKPMMEMREYIIRKLYEN